MRNALFPLLVLLAGCGGAGPSGSTAPAPTSRVLVSLTHAFVGDDAADPPRSAITLVVTDPDGNATATELLEVTGECRALVPTQGVLASQHCWYAGRGVRIHVRQVGDALVVAREDLTERSDPDALRAPEMQRFSLSPGTVAQAAETAP